MLLQLGGRGHVLMAIYRSSDAEKISKFICQLISAPIQLLPFVGQK
jgi:hypothetical protein